MDLEAQGWRRAALAQAQLVTRAQLAALGIPRHTIERRIRTERWQAVSSHVIATVTGDLTPTQQLWRGVLHAGPECALVAGVHAAALAGLRNWDRPEVTILVPHTRGRPVPLAGFRFQRTRLPLADLRSAGSGVPRCRIEPAVLLFAAGESSRRTVEGLLAAVVQQRLATPSGLAAWLERFPTLPRRAHVRRMLDEIAGGAQSVAEVDVARMCRRFGLELPRRQTKRKDSSGRNRFTDCEWLLGDGRVLVLEVDGSFHMEVEHWEDDLARQRALSARGRVIVHCTARQLRDEPEMVARDLVRLGVPSAA